jgi:hypothetical protein
MTPALFDWTLPSFFAPVPRIYFRLEESKIVILVIRNRFVFSHMVFRELGRGDVMKLIRISTQKPIALTHVLSRYMKHVTAQTRFGEIDRLLPDRDDPFIAPRELLYNFPCVINTAGIEDVNRVCPFEPMHETLLDDVGFVANGQKTMKAHVHAGFMATANN